MYVYHVSSCIYRIEHGCSCSQIFIIIEIITDAPCISLENYFLVSVLTSKPFFSSSLLSQIRKTRGTRCNEQSNNEDLLDSFKTPIALFNSGYFKTISRCTLLLLLSNFSNSLKLQRSRSINVSVSPTKAFSRRRTYF